MRLPVPARSSVAAASVDRVTFAAPIVSALAAIWPRAPFGSIPRGRRSAVDPRFRSRALGSLVACPTRSASSRFFDSGHAHCALAALDSLPFDRLPRRECRVGRFVLLALGVVGSPDRLALASRFASPARSPRRLDLVSRVRFLARAAGFAAGFAVDVDVAFARSLRARGRDRRRGSNGVALRRAAFRLTDRFGFDRLSSSAPAVSRRRAIRKLCLLAARRAVFWGPQ